MRKSYEISGTDFSRAGEASSNFKLILKQLGIPADIVRRVAISMYEAEINTVIHGGGGVCEAEISDKKIVISFSDNGPGISNVELAMTEGYSTATDRVRELGFGAGMGLPNMKRYADDLQIKTKPGEGTTVILTINL